MKDKFQHTHVRIASSVVIFSVLAAIVRAVLLLIAYEPDVGHFRVGLTAPLVAALYALGSAACIAVCILLPKQSIAICDNASLSRTLGLKLPASILFFLGGVSYLPLFDGATNSKAIYSFLGIYMILSTLYFIFSILSDNSKYRSRVKAAMPWLCLIVIVALLLLLATTYFDMTVLLNGPFTTLQIFSLLSCAVFLLFEMRNDIDCACPRLHFAAGLWSFFLAFSSSVSNLVFCLFGDTGVGRTIAEPMRHLVVLAFSVFVLARLLSFTAVKKEI